MKRLGVIFVLSAIAGGAPVFLGNATGQEEQAEFEFGPLEEAGEDQPADQPAAAAVAPAAQPSVVESAVVEAIRQSDPQTPSDLLRAVDQLIRLERPDAAREYLDRLVNMALDDAALAALYHQFGTAAMIRLTRTTELAPAGSEFALSVMQAGRRVLDDPARLSAWVRDLAAPNEAERYRAAEQLLRAGASSVPALVESMAAPGSSPEVSRLSLGVLRRLGTEAIEPLHAYLASGDSAQRATAITALGLIGSRESLPYLVAPLLVAHDQAGEDSGRVQRAADAWQRIVGRVPTHEEAVELLSLEADRAYQGRSGLAPDPDDYVTRWTWDGQRRRPVAQPMRSRDAAAVTASRLYEDLLRVRPEDARATERYLISRLALDQTLGGLDQPLRRGAGTAFAAAEKAGSRWVNRVLQRALDDDRDAAAMGAAEVLASLADKGVLERLQWGASDSAVPLVDALTHANRRVRFAAAQAIIRLEPDGSFHGAGRLADVLSYFATSTGSRAAVVAHPNPTRAQTLAGMMSSRGFRTAAVSTARDLEAAATSLADVELVMVSDTLNDASLWSTLEALRVHPHTARLPIAILARRDGRDAAQRISERQARTIVLNETADEAAIDLYLPQLLRLADRDAVSPQRRLEQAQWAARMLNRLKSGEQTRDSGSHAEDHARDHVQRSVGQ